MKNKRISIRADEKTFERIHRKAEKAGLPLTDFVVKSCLGSRIVVIDGLDEVIRQQKAIGNNLNQLTLLAHIGKIRAVRLDELMREYAMLNDHLSELIAETR